MSDRHLQQREDEERAAAIEAGTLAPLALGADAATLAPVIAADRWPLWQHPFTTLRDVADRRAQLAREHGQCECAFVGQHGADAAIHFLVPSPHAGDAEQLDALREALDAVVAHDASEDLAA